MANWIHLIAEAMGLPYSDDYKAFVAACLQKDPKARATAAQLLAMPLLAEAALLDKEKPGHRKYARAAKLTGSDQKPLNDLAAKSDALYKTLVATSEGGWLSGEEEIRERLGALYGSVNIYDGRPTDPQLHEATLIEAQIAKKSSAWDAIANKELPAANKTLAAKKLDPIKVISREEWDKKPGGRAAAAMVDID